MDVFESEKGKLQKHAAVETPRPPLVLADNNNGTTISSSNTTATRRSRTREVSSRYRSPTPSAPSGPRRCPSPNITRTGAASTVPAQKRAISAERKRPSTPPSPSNRSPSTPVQDTSAEAMLASKKVVGNRLPESLWPSTMRSLSVSFQSDTISVPVSRREKTATHALSDRTLRSSSNVAHRQGEAPPASRKPTPERKRSPLKGKNSIDQSENSRPVDVLNARLMDQHRWPSRTGGKVSSTALNRSIDLTDKTNKSSSLLRPGTGTGMPPHRRLSLDSGSKPLQKSASDLLMMVSSDDIGIEGFRTHSVDSNLVRVDKPISSNSLDRTSLVNSTVRSQSLPTSGSRPPSPIKASSLASSLSRGVSPSRTKTVPSSASSRGPSPSRIRSPSPSRQSSNPTSVLTFIADIKKGKKVANHIEDAHQLRLLYNRHLQWRYANARADSAMHSQKVRAERTLYSVWRCTSDMWDSVVEKRIEVQRLRLRLKLYAILNEQLGYLDEWASIENDHTSSLYGAIQDLQASTLRLPLTGGAKGDIENVRGAICSAVDVMKAMGSSIYYILSRVEGINCLVSELADVVAQERAMLDECESLLASTAALQVEEYSLRTQLMQLRQAW